MPNTKHFHCLSGDHGYMPDDNIPCKTRGQALACATDKAQELRSEGIKVDGKKSDGYYEVPNGQGAGLEYIEVTECHETDCLSELED